jgi:mannosyltransferase
MHHQAGDGGSAPAINMGTTTKQAQTTKTTARMGPTWECLAISFLLAIGILLRFWTSRPTDLWEDEVIATTHAVQPLWAVVVDTLRNDIHPPLYFLQLHFWSLLGSSDRWFMANSLLWSLLGLASLSFVASAFFGRRAGLQAAAIYAVLPSPVYMADQVRMYSMLVTLLLLSVYFCHQIFWQHRGGAARVVGLTFVQICLIITHALGALAVGLVAIYALVGVKNRSTSRATWAACYGILICVAVPWVGNAMMHEGDPVANARTFAAIVAGAAGGPLADQSLAAFVIGLTAFVLVSVAGLYMTPSRLLTTIFLLLPLLIGIASAAVLKPFLKWNFFSTITSPFIAMILALVISKATKLLRVAAVVLVILLVGLSAVERAEFRQSSRFLAAADFLRSNYKPGDVVLVPQPSYFHGLAWYLAGPRWGSPLEIAPLPSPSWSRVYEWLGPSMVKRLALYPKSQIMISGKFVLLTGNSSAYAEKFGNRIWFVGTKRADSPGGYPAFPRGKFEFRQTFVNGMWISLYSKQREQTLPAPNESGPWKRL